jgi:hypothetical protein
VSSHLPPLWKFRLLRAIHAKGNLQNRRLLAAWARAEGGDARYNPLNTTQPWPGATPYNTLSDGKTHVWDYRTGADGIAATAKTITNGHYNGTVAALRAGKLTARQIVTTHGREFDVWGTGATHILALL